MKIIRSTPYVTVFAVPGITVTSTDAFLPTGGEYVVLKADLGRFFDFLLTK